MSAGLSRVAAESLEGRLQLALTAISPPSALPGWSGAVADVAAFGDGDVAVVKPAGSFVGRYTELGASTGSLSIQGGSLFSVSRTKKRQPNDADRLRKYLARFGLDWPSLANAADC
jgi:transcriptional regulatory protein RtcR